MKKDMNIELDADIAAAFNASTSVSRKYSYFSNFNINIYKQSLREWVPACSRWGPNEEGPRTRLKRRRKWRKLGECRWKLI